MIRFRMPREGVAVSEDIERLDEVFGTLDVRVQRLAAELLDCIGAETKDEPDGRVVSLHLLAPEDDAALHNRSVQMCRAILDLCPEADIAEVIVVTPGGDRYSDGMRVGPLLRGDTSPQEDGLT